MRRETDCYQVISGKPIFDNMVFQILEKFLVDMPMAREISNDRKFPMSFSII